MAGLHHLQKLWSVEEMVGNFISVSLFEKTGFIKSLGFQLKAKMKYHDISWISRVMYACILFHDCLGIKLPIIRGCFQSSVISQMELRSTTRLRCVTTLAFARLNMLLNTCLRTFFLVGLRGLANFRSWCQHLLLMILSLNTIYCLWFPPCNRNLELRLTKCFNILK